MEKSATLKCDTCGYEGPISEFRYIGLAEEMGPNTCRQCPKCHGLVYCEELELRSSGRDVWGIGGVRGQVFKRRSKPDDDGGGTEG